MSQSEEIGRARAANALEHVTATEGVPMLVGEYTTSYAGDSITSSLAARFVDRHELTTGEKVQQFLDPESGALVIVPKNAPSGPGLGGD